MYQTTLLKSIHINPPNKNHHKTIDKKLKLQLKKVQELIIHHSRISHKITKKRATEVQSLKRLSHSNNIVSLLGAQSDLNIDKTATGSVEEIKVQKSKQTKNGISKPKNGKIKYKEVETIIAEISNQKTANQVIAFQFVINWR